MVVSETHHLYLATAAAIRDAEHLSYTPVVFQVELRCGTPSEPNTPPDTTTFVATWHPPGTDRRTRRTWRNDLADAGFSDLLRQLMAHWPSVGRPPR